MIICTVWVFSTVDKKQVELTATGVENGTNEAISTTKGDSKTRTR
jgi:hypothetical protein